MSAHRIYFYTLQKKGAKRNLLLVYSTTGRTGSSIPVMIYNDFFYGKFLSGIFSKIAGTLEYSLGSKIVYFSRMLLNIKMLRKILLIGTNLSFEPSKASLLGASDAFRSRVLL